MVALALMFLLIELGFLVDYVEDMWPYGEHFDIRARYVSFAAGNIANPPASSHTILKDGSHKQASVSSGRIMHVITHPPMFVLSSPS